MIIGCGLFYLIGHAAVHNEMVVEVPPCQLALREQHLQGTSLPLYSVLMRHQHAF